MKAEKDRAVAYVRVSSKKQEEFSPEAQIENIKAYADKQGLQLAKFFKEEKTAYKAGARSMFYDMIDYIKKEHVPNLIFAFTDRMYRNIPDYAKILEELGDNIRFHNVARGVSYNPNDPDDYEIIADEEHRIVKAKEESGRTRRKVKDACNVMVKKGYYPGAIPPLGYIRNPLHKVGIKKRAGRIEIDPVRGPLMVKMFLFYRTGEYNFRSLARRMRDEGLTSRNGNFVNHSRIESYLKNPFYYGRFPWLGKLSDKNESYEPLISKELWDEVQQVMADKSRQTRTTYAGKICKEFKYGKMLKCSLCGCSIVGEERHKKLKRSGKVASYVYYHCCEAKGKCDLAWFDEQEIDRYFDWAFAALEELTITPDIYEKARKKLDADYRGILERSRDELVALKNERSQIEAKKSTINNYLMNQQITPDEYREMKDSLNLRGTEVETRISDLQRETENYVDFACDTLKLITDFKIKYLQGNAYLRKKLNSLLFKTISLRPRQQPGIKGERADCLYIEWNEPFATLFQNYKKWFLEQDKLEEASSAQEKKFGGADET